MPCCITLPRTNAIQPQPPYLLGVHCKFTLASKASESLTPSYRPPSSTPPFNCLAKSSVILPINSLAVVGHHKSSIVSRLNGPAHSWRSQHPPLVLTTAAMDRLPLCYMALGYAHFWVPGCGLPLPFRSPPLVLTIAAMDRLPLCYAALGYAHFWVPGCGLPSPFRSPPVSLDFIRTLHRSWFHHSCLLAPAPSCFHLDSRSGTGTNICAPLTLFYFSFVSVAHSIARWVRHRLSATPRCTCVRC